MDYDNKIYGPHEAGLLLLETSKARHFLGVESRLNLTESIKLTLDWYQSQASGLDARKLCENDIFLYESLQSAA